MGYHPPNRDQSGRPRGGPSKADRQAQDRRRWKNRLDELIDYYTRLRPTDDETGVERSARAALDREIRADDRAKRDARKANRR